MKKIFPLAALAAASFTLAGCGYTPEQRAGSGAIVGANTRPVPPPPPPGYYPPPPPRCAQVGYDAYGNPVCTAYYGY